MGKTHLAIALGVRVCELGQRAYFTTAIELARRLTEATREQRLHREMKNLVRPSLLIIDEVGYLTLDATQASLIFQVIAERYEKGQAIILTSNKAFGEWAGVFAGDAVMASAALDRLLHRATVLNIRGDSYRLKVRRRSGERLETLEPDDHDHRTQPEPSPATGDARQGSGTQGQAGRTATSARKHATGNSGNPASNSINQEVKP